ncbi:MAG: NAD(P)-binding domain-containing protein [Ginsengibacter sp.]
MPATKTIAIIGATGSMGSAIAKSLSGSSNRVLLFARDIEKLTSLLEEIKEVHPNGDVEIIGCPTDACWEADIIIPAVPFGAENEVAEKIRTVATGKIVISISNPLNDAYNGLVTTPDTSAAEELQKLLPYSKVIKAFNTSFAASFTNPVIDGKIANVFIAGNDEESLETVSELVKISGFNPIIAGGLPVSRTLENMQLLLISLGRKYNYNGLAGWKILHN